MSICIASSHWNDLPESLISSSELSDDSVSKFTSLVRARDLFPPVTAPGEGLSIWRFTSKLFRFRFRPVVSQPENSGCLELTSAVSQSHRHLTIEGETTQVQLDLNKLSPKGGVEQSSILVENCEDSDVVCARCLKRGSRTELRRCAGCKSFSYCTKDCLISDWPSHTQLCKSIQSLNDPQN